MPAAASAAAPNRLTVNLRIAPSCVVSVVATECYMDGDII